LGVSCGKPLQDRDDPIQVAEVEPSRLHAEDTGVRLAGRLELPSVLFEVPAVRGHQAAPTRRGVTELCFIACALHAIRLPLGHVEVGCLSAPGNLPINALVEVELHAGPRTL